jgi:hypothetical protein
MGNRCASPRHRYERPSKRDKLPTAARQPACYRRSAVWRAAVDNSAQCHALRAKRPTACALNRYAAGSPTPPSHRYCVTLNRNITMAKNKCSTAIGLWRSSLERS